MTRDRTIVLTPPPSAAVLAVARELLPAGFRLITASAEELVGALDEGAYLVGFVGELPEAALAPERRPKLVQLLSAGYDKLDLERLRRAGVPAATNGGANAVAVAEHAVMLMLAVYRRLLALADVVRGGGWTEATRSDLGLHELEGKTVGLLGLGQIGRMVARRVQAFGCAVRYYDAVRLPPEQEAALGVEYLPFVDLLRAADVLSIHVPLTAQTRGLIGAAELAQMKPGAVLINTARGGIVDEEALLAALRSGRLLGAGLDVFAVEPPPADHPLRTLPNVVATPHTAGPTWESWPKRFRNAYANVARVARGEPPLWTV
jgi:phosphoglycerate dehydrogenase-like enzyme